MMKMKELMAYVNLLRELLAEGFKCEKELQEALKLLHKEMIPQKENNKDTSILVLEKSYGDMEKTFNIFRNMFGKPSQYIQRKDVYILGFGNVKVRIYNLEYKIEGNKFRGNTFDLFLNNANVVGEFSQYIKVR
jgi:hypothetical protein